MYINDRDQINYHGFLKAVREMQGASLKQVAEGICSDSEISRMEIGDRLPEKLMRDRVTSRLGVSGEEYEEYLRPEEYRQWEIRMFILDHINKGDAEAVQKGIDEFDKIQDKNPVQEQFADTMRYMLAKMNGASDDLLRALIELTVVHTIPDIDAAFAGAQLLSDQELNLIAEYTHLREYYGDAEDEVAWRLAEYQKILDYIDNSYMDEIDMSKTYPRITNFICDLILKERASKEYLEYGLDLCCKSIEILRDASRLHYLIELLEHRKHIVELLLEHADSETKVTEFNSLCVRDSEWEKILRNLYTQYNIPVYMQNFTYLYTETECNNVVEVIRTRRNMLKLSRVKVSDNICTEKTVERFENYTHSPSIVVVRDIFDRIGLCAEYKRARVLTSDAEVLRLSHKLATHVNNYNLDEMQKCIDKLNTELHLEIPYNEQEMKRKGYLVDYWKKKLDKDELEKLAVEALECSIPMQAIIRNGNKYFSRVEIELLSDLAFDTDGDLKIVGLEILKNMCLEAMNSKMEASRVCVFELILSRLASYYGDMGEYDLSIEMSNAILKECLFHRRMDNLSENIYNNLWNYQKQSVASKDTLKIIEELKCCVVLSEIVRKSNWKAFFQNKLKEMEFLND